jgi:hypothetical protein
VGGQVVQLPRGPEPDGLEAAVAAQHAEVVGPQQRSRRVDQAGAEDAEEKFLHSRAP